jgi:microcystin-dependent protein
MSTPFMGEVKIISFNFAPKGWALCNGQLLPINQNQALFSLLGTTYGGNGQTNFALPNLQGRIPIHIGQGIIQGQAAGEFTHTLTTSEMAAHTHPANAAAAPADQPTPAAFQWTDWGKTYYSASPNSSMLGTCLTNVGGSQPHDNMSPYLVLNFVIALQGIFPSRN